MKNEKDNNKRYAPVVILICVMTVFVSVCCAFLIASSIKPELRDTVKENVNNFLYQEKTEAQVKENTTARLMCAGNNVIYRSIYTEAESFGKESGNAYDFSPMYENVKNIISKADIAAINQSSVISSTLPVSTFPNFCSPVQVGDALYSLGFRVINHANANVFDKDVQGAEDTLSYWGTKSDVTVSGLYKSEEDRNAVKIKEVNGIKIAFLGFTDSVQTELTAETPINVISLTDRNRSQAEIYNIMKEMIKKAKESADVAVVYMSFNNASEEITEAQQQTVNYLVSFGADVIIGCGTNRIQKAERIVRDDKTSAVVFYSLGNFISAEEKKENMLGGIADIVFEKNGETEETIVKSAKAVPVVTYYESGYKNFSVLPAENITSEDLASHALNSYYGGFTAEYAKETFANTFTAIPDADFLPESTNEAENTSKSASDFN